MSNVKKNISSKFGRSCVREEHLLYQGRWSNLVEFSYEDEKKQIRKWEGLHRKNNAEAVIIIAKMEPSERYIIIRQFRPPTNSYLLEFPAGLVDSGETREQTAIRELSEETGYLGEVKNISPRLYSSPGILSEAVSIAHIEVDENLPKNKRPKAHNEPGEFISVSRNQ
jgi:NTP pyrophosphohydrolases including oxidative damage repair enzymes